VKIKYNVEIEDLIEFNEYYVGHSPEARRLRRSHTVYAPLAVFFSVSFVGIIEHSWVFPIIGAIFASVYSLGAPRRLRKRSRRVMEKLFSEGKNISTLGKQQLELKDDGIYNTSSAGTQSTYWNAVEHIEQTETHGFIYISSMSAHVIPALKVEEGDFNEFMQAARDHLPCASTP
jgi:hypothetical protein